MSTVSVFSDAWYQVADLRPRLRQHAQIFRQIYRGETWFLLKDHVSGQFHRFSPQAHEIIGRLDGQHTVQEIWEIACRRLGDDMPSQDEVIQLLHKLHNANALHTRELPDIQRMGRNRERQQRQKRGKQWASPLSVRLPLVDPQAFLARSGRLTRWLFSPLSGVLALLLLVAGAGAAGIHWEPFTENLRDRLLSGDNLLFMVVLYPLAKLCHELAHAYAVHRWGGEVHEMGVMLLVLFPVPYVDATAATAFENKYQRMMVGAAGIVAELLLAALAMLAWTVLEPGTAKAMAYALVMMAGLSSLLFNGNPLLRFDAYYMLADWLEIPNLGQRSNAYLGYLLKHYLLRLPGLHTPARDRREAVWLALYGVAAFLYRMGVMVGIALFVAESYLFAGVLLLLWSSWGMLVLPMSNMVRKVAKDPLLRRHRGRVAAVAGGLLALLVGGVGWLPLPLATHVQGVAWVAEEGRLRAGVSGFVTELQAHPGALVTADQPVLRLTLPQLAAQVALAEAQWEEAEARVTAAAGDPLALSLARGEAEHMAQRLDRLREQQALLTVRAQSAGVLLLPRQEELLGRFVQRGQQVGYVVDFQRLTVRALLPEEGVDLVRGRVASLELRLSSRPGETFPARLVQVVPHGDQPLISPVLATQGGGAVEVDPREDPPRPLFNHFLVMVEAPGVPWRHLEERVHLLFHHPPEPLIQRWWRALRRMFLRRFDI